MVWHAEACGVDQIIAVARSVLFGWRAAQEQGRECLNRTERRAEEVWKKPVEGRMKVNVDAATGMGGKRGLAWVVRDAAGQFVAAGAKPWEGNISPKEAEILGVREALSWLKENRWDCVDIESDASQVVSAIYNGGGVAQFGLIVEDVRDLMKDFNSISIAFIRRSANRVAHTLARAAVSLSDSHVWLSIPPTCIMQALSHDFINNT
ncbi:unnamed protein product [Cuscuta epithymum]|uniref:RNase H type-1 domain-containing protein n=1 Tax=Cuscuta epithymum TaxID=186058 RepID=A0AAV0G4F5_9ASTE|nr:unnamed protein product [Cuscuta epithymum]